MDVQTAARRSGGSGGGAVLSVAEFWMVGWRKGVGAEVLWTRGFGIVCCEEVGVMGWTVG